MPQNYWTNFLALQAVISSDTIYEDRMENDSAGNILYVGLCPRPKAPRDEPIWLILKLSYDGNGFLEYKQLPDQGASFSYVWDDRASYFS